MCQSGTRCTGFGKGLLENLLKKMRAIACMERSVLASMLVVLSNACVPNTYKLVSLYHVLTFARGLLAMNGDGRQLTEIETL